MNTLEQEHQPAPFPSSQPGLPLNPKTIWQWKWCMLLSTLATVGAGLVYLHYAPQTYKAGARIIVEKSLASPTGASNHRDPRFIPNRVETIRSPVVVLPALEAVRNSTADKFSQEEIDRTMASVHVAAVDRTNVIRIEYSAADGRSASRFVEALVRSYQAHVQRQQEDVYLRTHAVLAEREGKLRNEVQRLEEQLLQLRENSPLVGSGSDAMEVELVQLRQLGESLALARNRRIQLENTLSVAAGLPPGPSIATVSDTDENSKQWHPGADRGSLDLVAVGAPSASVSIDEADPKSQEGTSLGNTADVVLKAISDPSTIQAELLRADARVEKLSQQFGPKHRALRSIKQEVSFWKSMLREKAIQELEHARRTETELASAYGEELHRVKSFNVHRAREEHLANDVRRTEENHTLALEKLGDWELAKQVTHDGRGIFDVRVLEPPKEFGDLAWPRPGLFLAVCAMIGLVIGGAPVIFSEGEESA